MSHPEKNLFSSHSMEKNSMGFKSPKRWKMLAAVTARWASVRSILSFTRWKRRDWLTPDGEMSQEKIEGEQDGAITNSPEMGSPLWNQFRRSARIYSFGSLAKERMWMKISKLDTHGIEFVEIFDDGNDVEYVVVHYRDSSGKGESLEMQSRGFSKLPEWKRVKLMKAAIDHTEAKLDTLEKRSALEKRLRKYKSFDPAETWISRWLSSPIAYLFPEERREEWLGDLYELHREMLHKKYPWWLINCIDLGRTIILVISALQIKISDFFSPTSQRSK